MRQPFRFEGVMPANILPFRADLEIDEPAYRRHLRWLAGQPVWCRWLDGALYVVHGPGEQPAPPLALSTVDVSVRGDHGGPGPLPTAS